MEWSNENKDRPSPPRPTLALPGTKAKIRVMARRVACDYQPFHADDAKYDDAGIERLIAAVAEISKGRTRPKGRGGKRHA